MISSPPLPTEVPRSSAAYDFLTAIENRAAGLAIRQDKRATTEDRRAARRPAGRHHGFAAAADCDINKGAAPAVIERHAGTDRVAAQRIERTNLHEIRADDQASAAREGDRTRDRAPVEFQGAAAENCHAADGTAAQDFFHAAGTDRGAGRYAAGADQLQAAAADERAAGNAAVTDDLLAVAEDRADRHAAGADKLPGARNRRADGLAAGHEVYGRHASNGHGVAEHTAVVLHHAPAYVRADGEGAGIEDELSFVKDPRIDDRAT